ncbi:MAG: FAD-binding oxidoreductase [Anaerolineales bacterium]
MKRWNGWGNTQTHYPLPESAEDYLRLRLGSLPSLQDAELQTILNTVPQSSLPDHPLIQVDPEIRLRHSRGQSLPDWVALNYGRIAAFPDGVAFPENEDQVAGLLEFARGSGAHVIPFGGGSSVVGHINPRSQDKPTITLSLEKMDQLLDIDRTSKLAEFQAGVAGPALERQLAAQGFILGHFPQSFEYSTLGGWIATRSSGQQSIYYGRIEDLFAGGQVATPEGFLELPVYPASAAGPDLRQLVLGSEGRLGVITKATVRIRKLPQQEGFYGVFFPSWEDGCQAVRQIAQSGIPVSMLRLSNPQETETTLILSGKSWIDLADRGLRLIGMGGERCLLIFGATGRSAQVTSIRRQTAQICRSHGGLQVGSIVGHTWEKSRFISPYLRNTLWVKGIAVDTLETALPWSQVKEASQAIPESITHAAQNYQEQVLVMTHLSHIYPDGASIYTTYLFRRDADPDRLLEVWDAMKDAASQQIQALGGTISHQHGVGLDHKRYLPAEKGLLGILAIRNSMETFDPDRILNPGKLYDDQED